MSKRKFFLAIFLASVSTKQVLAAAIPLSEAVKQKKVSVDPEHYTPPSDGKYHASYFNQCMQLKVKNLTSIPLALTESAGRFLVPDDTDKQRMMMTADITFNLKSGEEKSILLYAMCTQATNGAPSDADRFTYGSAATGELKELVSFIASKNYQNEAAQHAVWSITDGYSPYSIFDDDTVVMNSLRRKVCAIKKITYNPASERVTENSPLVRYITGTFTFSIYKEQKVDLVIFTDDNKLIKNVIQNETFSAGSHTVDYDASIPVLDPSKPQSVVMMFYLDGVLFAHKKHVLPPWQ